MRLRVTSCLPVYNGTNQKGDAYTIYEVLACREDGTVVERKLRSFEDLPLQVLDLMVSKFDSEKHGESFTLSRKDKPGTHQRIDAVEHQLQMLTNRVEMLEGNRQAVAQPGTGGAQTGAPIVTDDADRQAELDARFGEAPPY